MSSASKRAELLRQAARADLELSLLDVELRLARTLFHPATRSTAYIEPCCDAAIRRENLWNMPRSVWSCRCECHRDGIDKMGLGRDAFCRVREPAAVWWIELRTPWDSRCGSLDLNWEEFPDLYDDLVDETEAAKIGLDYYYAMERLGL